MIETAKKGGKEQALKDLAILNRPRPRTSTKHKARKRPERAQGKQQERYRSFIETMDEAYFEVDLKGRFIFCNDAFSKVHGLAKEDLIGMSFKQIMSPSASQKALKLFHHFSSNGHPARSFEMKIIKGDGTKAVLETSPYLILNGKGERIGFRGIARDITKNKQTEEAARKAIKGARHLAKENAIISKISQIIGSTLNIDEVYESFAGEVKKIIPFDRIVINVINTEKNTVRNVYISGKKVENRETEKIYPLDGSGNAEMVRTRSSLLIQTEDFDPYKGRFPMLLPTFQAGFRSILNVPLFSKGKIVGGLLLRSRKPHAYTNRDVRTAEKIGNEIAGAVANAQLFAELKQSEDAQRREKDRSQKYLDMAAVILVVLEPDEKVSLINKKGCEILGYNEEEIKGTNWFETYIPNSERERVRSFFIRLMTQGGEDVKYFENPILTKSGRERIIAWHNTILRDQAGHIIGTLSSGDDVTERKQMEQMLMKGRKEAQRLAEENAIMSEIGRIINSTLNIDEVFEACTNRIAQLIPFDRVVVNLLDPGENTTYTRYAAGIDIPQRPVGEKIPMEGSLTGECLRKKSALLIQPEQPEDMEEIKCRLPGLWPTIESGIRSIVATPLISRNQAIGVLTLRSRKAKAYTTRDVNLSESIASQIAGAIASAQLYEERLQAERALRASEEEARQWAYENAVLASIGRITTAGLNIDASFKHFAEEVRKLLPYDRIVINLINKDGKTIINRYAEGDFPRGKKIDTVFPMAGTVCEAVINNRKGLSFDSGDDNEVAAQFPAILPEIEDGFRSFLSVPLFFKNKVIGGFHLRSKKARAYLEHDLQLAESVASQIAGTIANAQFFNELKEGERFLNNIFSSIQDRISVIDNDFNIIRVNPEIEKRYLQVLPITGKKCYEVYRGRTQRCEICPSNKTMATGEVANEVVPKIAKDGRVFGWLDLYSYPLIDTLTGKTKGVIEYTRDISESRKMQETLRRNEILLRKVIDALPVGVSIVAKDGRVLYTNPAREEIWGEKAFLGIDQLGRYKGRRKMTGIEMQGEDWPLYRAVKKQETCLNEIVEIEDFAGQKKTVIHSGIPILDTNGEMFGAIGVNQDITYLHQAEERLKRSEEHFRSLIDNSSDIILTLDKSGNISYASPSSERVLQYKPESILGTNAFQYIHSDDLTKALEGFNQALQNSEIIDPIEIRLRHTDGSWKTFQIIGKGALDENKNPITIVNCRDITEQKGLEAQLAQSQKLEAVGQLAAGIAHEINTPIQYVGDNTKFFQDAFKDLTPLLQKYEQLRQAIKADEAAVTLLPEIEAVYKKADPAYLIEEIPKAIQQTLEGVERVANIVRAMKEFSHPGTKEKTAIDLNRAIENTVTVARNEWKYVAEMDLDLDSSLPPVLCLPGEINQVLLNMIVNAAHAIADNLENLPTGKGKITVRSRQVDPWVEIQIGDTGTGIPREIQERIFEPFFTTKSVGKGTGQGLTIAYSVIVQKHGGTIHLESEVGKGTTFYVRLPLNGQANPKRLKEEAN